MKNLTLLLSICMIGLVGSIGFAQSPGARIPAGSFFTQVATPTDSPGAGGYGPTQTVTLADATSGATILYTTNGTTPSCPSTGTTYTTGISISVTTTIKAIGCKSGSTASTVLTSIYTINGAVATPTDSPGAGTYGSTQTVTLADATGGSTILYTTSGTPPACPSTGTTYTTGFSVAATTTVKAIGCKTGFSDSSVLTSSYTISAGGSVTFISANTVDFATGGTTTDTVPITGTTGAYIVVGTSSYSSGGVFVPAAVTMAPSGTACSLVLDGSALQPSYGYSMNLYLCANVPSGTTGVVVSEVGAALPCLGVAQFTGITAMDTITPVATNPYGGSAPWTTNTLNHATTGINVANVSFVSTLGGAGTGASGTSGPPAYILPTNGQSANTTGVACSVIYNIETSSANPFNPNGSMTATSFAVITGTFKP